MGRRAMMLIVLSVVVGCETAPILTTPAPPDGPSLVLLEPGTVAEVAVGDWFACALRTNGSVACWGLGSVMTTPPTGIFTQISAGGSHVCGIRPDSTLSCWGTTYYQATLPSGTFKFLSVASNYACAVTTAGALRCWGSLPLPPPPTGTFARVETSFGGATCGLRVDETITCWGGLNDAPSGHYTDLAVREDVACALDAQGRIVCWGERAPSPAQMTGAFIDVSAGSRGICAVRDPGGGLVCFGSQPTSPLTGSFVRVSVGGTVSCAVGADGVVRCWGYNELGESTPPTDTYSQVEAGGAFTCGLTTRGTLRCWGDYDFAGANFPSDTFVNISAGILHACGIRQSDAAIKCWGLRFYSYGPPPAGSFVEVSSGLMHDCALRADSTAACWGDNRFGQASAPSGIFAQVSAGEEHSCGIRRNGEAECWGDNSYGQAAAPPGPFIHLSAGIRSTCGLRQDGSIICWGASPAILPEGQFRQMSASGAGGCALRPDDTVECWGTTSAPPTALFTQVSNRWQSNPCGLEIDKSITCWGRYAVRETPNTAPTITLLSRQADDTAPLQLVGGAAYASLALAFDDPVKAYDTHTAIIDCGNGATITRSDAFSPLTVACPYQLPGIYTVRATITDEFGASSTEATYKYLVVYDPEGAFATGGGSIDASGSQQARFAFSVKFLPGKTAAPSGTAKFWLGGGDIDVRSTAIEMLVASHEQIQFWGPATGEVNGRRVSRFRISALPSTTSFVGAFRIELWDAAGALLYDTEPSTPRDLPASTPLAAGAITLHAGGR